jgi:hypothetical protein
MRFTYLLERADQLWGGVKVVLEDANWLAARGHDITVAARSGPPAWMDLRCRFVQVPDFAPEHLPRSDVHVGTLWTTVPFAIQAGPWTAVHFCQGYEGELTHDVALRAKIDSVYRLPAVNHVTVSSHLTRLLRERFGIAARQVTQAIDHSIHFPAPPRPAPQRVRVGLVGPYQVAGKGIAEGLFACALAHAAGLDLEVVRVTNTGPDPHEQQLPFPSEWHAGVVPSAMGPIYRSLDVLLAPVTNPGEGFYLPAVEAMACGVPCVLTDLPCFREHGSGAYALFVPPADAVAMAKALVVAARDPTVRGSLRAGGIAVAARYTKDDHGRQLEQALLEALLAAAA